MEQTDLRGLPFEKLEAETLALGLPAFRARQIFSWLHQKRAEDFSEMTELPKAVREQLSAHYHLAKVSIERKLVSAKDGTVKYLYALEDGEHVEGVRMAYQRGGSLCISTQCGCRMGCTFCASTLTGLSRNLTASEMLMEVYLAAKDAEASGEKVASIVLMGIGEPLDNFDNVMDFLTLVTNEQGFNMGMRHISLSTCGLVDQIDKLAEKKLQLTLSVSLHAPNDDIRRRTMPIARRWPMEELMRACRDYFDATGRRISFEYALIDGVNDGPEHAAELIRLLKGTGSHVNLIPVNRVAETGYRRSKREKVDAFCKLLNDGGVNATVRRELGSDINAACGQLRRSVMDPEAANAGLEGISRTGDSVDSGS
ncbi:MAG TPA: 23S rRNA (adenine(2503)-C(2))-methyltransferase RlmN [Oscillospiraceae bacterium]|nr:23S rRNA (adenine(2503)-C(2))-methyltransferase RlmN [Oscillospiraceae bacterium]HRW56552.1 23S rRNA (adenine(2503)-C(2))-methyltransferase RlmN [Oscillospiraceae bacterium]